MYLYGRSRRISNSCVYLYVFICMPYIIPMGIIIRYLISTTVPHVHVYLYSDSRNELDSLTIRLGNHKRGIHSRK